MAKIAKSTGGLQGWLVEKAKDLVAASQSDGALEWLDVPDDLTALGVMALLAPPGTVLQDLFDPEDMLTLIGSRTHGVREVTCRDDLCLLDWPASNARADPTGDLQRLLAYVQSWVKRGL